uniref:Uncharacterized protein n=1 Tax=Rhizophagus irregularis (strain DAOM 181602 / DAOM 197198 / MUCL 43194) TaxID=747089 RepID=U9UUM0_RHIID
MFFVVYYYCTIIENVSRNKFNCFSKFSNYGEKKKKQLCDVILEPDAGLN